jgi:hypothetical protein
MSPVPLAGVVSGQFSRTKGTVRPGAIRNRVRAESGPREVSTRAPTQLPWRVMVATAQTRTQSWFPVGRPRQKAPLEARAGRAKEPRRRGESGLGKVRATSSLGRRENTSPYCKANAT